MQRTPGVEAEEVFVEAVEASALVEWAEASEEVAVAFVQPGSAAGVSPVSDVRVWAHGGAVVRGPVCVPA